MDWAVIATPLVNCLRRGIEAPLETCDTRVDAEEVGRWDETTKQSLPWQFGCTACDSNYQTPAQRDRQTWG